MNLDIQLDETKQQFYALVEGKLCTLDYTKSADGSVLDFRSTYVPRELRGHQIGQSIVKFALDYAKEHGYKVIPSCPFVASFIENNPEYKAIVK